MKMMMFFWVVTPCGPAGGEIYRLPPNSTPKMEEASFSETLVSAQESKQRYKKENVGLQCHSRTKVCYLNVTQTDITYTHDYKQRALAHAVGHTQLCLSRMKQKNVIF